MKKMMIASATVLALALAGCGNKADKAADKMADKAAATTEKAMDTAKEAMPEMPAKKSTAEIEAARWMKANGARPNVTTRPSGLQVTINESGDVSGKSPYPGQKVKVHYEGKLINGEVFDSSYKRGTPAVFPSDQLIAGWVEALAEMKPGDEWTLYIPPELAYGGKNIGDGLIPPHSPLIFRMELLELVE